MKSFSKYSILIVDDELDICQSIKEKIKRRLGCRTYVAHNGLMALEKIKETMVDMAIIDLKMPKMDGLTLLENIKEYYSDKIICLVLTGHADIENVKKAYKLGAYDFMDKPVVGDILIRHIVNGLEKVRLREDQRKYFDKLKYDQEELYNKKILLRTLCHDLNNTLDVIWSSSKYLTRHAEKKELSFIISSIKQIYQMAEYQRQIIEDVRTREEIVSGSKELHLEKVMVEELYQMSMSVFKEKLKDKNVSMVYETNEDNITIDIEKIAFSNNVMNNLVSNALKFSKSDGLITFRVAREDDGTVNISIIDQGIGIPKDILKKLFSLDGRAISRNGTHGERGTGFGMPQVKATLERYNAEIFVESKDILKHPEDHGTVIKMTFKKA